ncbi:hypothetical protein BT96DRAFT_311217 [Gymnopus androsaceus JB14]|uniref:DUF6697 domain-containing protein n=1 Tax=Gymnopus androsaceus JB14 TaxID=1447944 RepID=A0A6A4H2C7_9AGAR|nr:hypothetical protein BT96DRAFT_311217 [Gymnopus androsaceus JB14]
MDAYGGGKTSFLQAYPLKYPSIRLNIKSVPGASQTKQRIFVFPNAAPELNAHFPARPGAHGLMFGMKPQIESLLKDDDSVICELFAAAPEIRFTTAVSKSIEYYGTYRISETRPMTAEEFKAQSKTIQEAIASEIIDAGPGGTIRYLANKSKIGLP